MDSALPSQASTNDEESAEQTANDHNASPQRPLMLDASGIHATVDNHHILRGLHLHLHAGEIGTLLGPSGCGKTTLLRAIAGLQTIQKGQIRLRGQTVANGETGLHAQPEARKIGFIFQDLALFPHLSIEKNVGFGLSHLSKDNKKKTVDAMLELVDMQGCNQSFPHELSGGQQQRIAIARALAPKPSLLLMDEPFSSLDSSLRMHLASDLRTLLIHQNMTALIVTHDQAEALAMSDRCGYLNQGRLEQWDTPYTLYHEPVNETVAEAIGYGHFIDGRCLNPTQFTTPLGDLQGNRAYPFTSGESVKVLIRPDDVVIDETSSLRLTVAHRLFTGASFLYTLSDGRGTDVKALFNSHDIYTVGDALPIRIQTDHLIVFSSN